MHGRGPDRLCGLSRWPWASSGTAHSVPPCLAQRTVQSAPRQGVKTVWVDSGEASYAGHTVDRNRYLLFSCPGWS